MHLTAHTPKLVIGDLIVSGDPEYYNGAGDLSVSGYSGTDTFGATASGSITVGGLINAADAWLTAGNNITVTGSITTSLASIILNAGGAITVDGLIDSITSVTPRPVEIYM